MSNPVDDRAEPPRGRDRLQPRHAGAQHEHLRGRDRPRGGHEHREEALELGRGDQHRAVAGHRRLRRQRIHRLRAADARDPLHRQRGRAGRGDRLQPAGSPSGLRKPTRIVPARSLASSAVRRRRDLRDDLGAPRIADLGARGRRTARPVAPAARPAPDSTITSCSAARSRRTTSGTRATRRSRAAVSFGAPIFKRRGTLTDEGDVAEEQSSGGVHEPIVGAQVPSASR